MRRIALLTTLVAIGVIRPTSGAEYIVRVERISASDPAIPDDLRRPMTIEFYVRAGVPFRCELTIGKETLGCRGLVRRLSDGKVWLSAETQYSKRNGSVEEPLPGASAKLSEHRNASVGMLVEIGKPIAAEWIGDNQSLTSGVKSRVSDSTRDGVRWTLREAERSIRDELKSHFERIRNPLPDDDAPAGDDARNGQTPEQCHAVRWTKVGFVDDREGDLPSPPEELLYAFEIEVAEPGWFHGRAVFNEWDCWVAGRLDRPKEDGSIGILLVEHFSEYGGSSTGTWEAAISRNESLRDGAGQSVETTEINGKLRTKVRAKYERSFLVRTIAASDDDPK